jgi:hypothetical protein
LWGCNGLEREQRATGIEAMTEKKPQGNQPVTVNHLSTKHQFECRTELDGSKIFTCPTCAYMESPFCHTWTLRAQPEQKDIKKMNKKFHTHCNSKTHRDSLTYVRPEFASDEVKNMSQLSIYKKVIRGALYSVSSLNHAKASCALCALCAM